MLDVYVRRDGRLARLPAISEIPPDAVWIDMLRPTAEEEALVERAAGVDVPTQEEMVEIAASSRLYEDGGRLFMPATVLSKADTAQPVVRQVSFVLQPGPQCTVRYSEPRSEARRGGK